MEAGCQVSVTELCAHPLHPLLPLPLVLGFSPILLPMTKAHRTQGFQIPTIDLLGSLIHDPDPQLTALTPNTRSASLTLRPSNLSQTLVLGSEEKVGGYC